MLNSGAGHRWWEVEPPTEGSVETLTSPRALWEGSLKIFFRQTYSLQSQVCLRKIFWELFESSLGALPEGLLYFPPPSACTTVYTKHWWCKHLISLNNVRWKARTATLCLALIVKTKTTKTTMKISKKTTIQMLTKMKSSQMLIKTNFRKFVGKVVLFRSIWERSEGGREKMKPQPIKDWNLTGWNSRGCRFRGLNKMQFMPSENKRYKCYK